MLYKKIKTITSSLVLISILQGCSFAEPQLHNLSFEKWNDKIELDLQDNMLDNLITDYQIFSNEFKNSKLMPGVSLKIINYLILNKKWKESVSFIKLHLERYQDNLNSSYLNFLIVKVRFSLLTKPDRLQRKYSEILNLIASYKLNFPKSVYMGSIEDMEDSLKLEKCFFDRDISLLYKKLGKNKACDYYTNIYKKCGFNLNLLERPNAAPFYIRFFEGNGEESLLGKLIPDEKQLIPKVK